MKFLTAAAILLAGHASAFSPSPALLSSTPVSSTQMHSLKEDLFHAGKVVAGAALMFGIATAPADAMSKADLKSLSYLQVKGSGLANRCSDVVGDDSISPRSGQKLVDMCFEPKAWAVEDIVSKKGGNTEKKFVNSKVLTRQTYSLDAVEGDLDVGGNSITFREKEGLDYAPITLKMPGGQEIPMLYTVKELVAKGDGTTLKPGYQLTGGFTVPSYRTGLFQDPKGRGGTTGYDEAVALPALQTGLEGDDSLFRENNKVFDVTTGKMAMEISQVDASTGEVGGVWVAEQMADSDMGAHDAKKVLMKGIFYGRVD